jgi:hypothetical protein
MLAVGLCKEWAELLAYHTFRSSKKNEVVQELLVDKGFWKAMHPMANFKRLLPSWSESLTIIYSTEGHLRGCDSLQKLWINSPIPGSWSFAVFLHSVDTRHGFSSTGVSSSKRCAIRVLLFTSTTSLFSLRPLELRLMTTV